MFNFKRKLRSFQNLTSKHFWRHRVEYAKVFQPTSRNACRKVLANNQSSVQTFSQRKV